MAADHLSCAYAARGWRFRAAGWPDMIYLPTDWRTPEGHWKLSFNPKHGFAMLASAFHEYAGLLIYWATGAGSRHRRQGPGAKAAINRLIHLGSGRQALWHNHAL